MSTEANPRTLFDIPADAGRSTVLTVVRLALRLARRHLQPYGSYKSRHDFTQPQLMVCLILRAYRKATYREIVDQLQSSWELREAICPDLLYADAGYDAEWIHEFCNERWGPYSVIKPVRHRPGRPDGAYRSQMTERTLKRLGYGRRWLVESYMSGLKRTTGWTLSARSHPARTVEAGLKVLAYALRR